MDISLLPLKILVRFVDFAHVYSLLQCPIRWLGPGITVLRERRALVLHPACHERCLMGVWWLSSKVTNSPLC